MLATFRQLEKEDLAAVSGYTGSTFIRGRRVTVISCLAAPGSTMGGQLSQLLGWEVMPRCNPRVLATHALSQ